MNEPDIKTVTIETIDVQQAYQAGLFEGERKWHKITFEFSELVAQFMLADDIYKNAVEKAELLLKKYKIDRPTP